MSRWLKWVWIGLLGGLAAASAEERVAILGDSITYGGRWATRVESALRETPRFRKAEIVNFGLGSETVSGLSEPGHAGGKFPRPCLHERLGRILEAFEPTLVLACYGMNDGIYLPPDEARMRAYQDGILRLKADVEKSGATLVLISPPLHQADQVSSDPQRYDVVLDGFAAWLTARRADGWRVIDIRPGLKQAVAEAKKADPAFVYAKDGVHPGDRGHDFIAAEICQALWKILDLPGTPSMADGRALDLLLKRNELLKLAWLTKTGHQRPGIPAGKPLDQAGRDAAEMLSGYRVLCTMKTSQWNGYERSDFVVQGVKSLLVRPKQAAPGRPWIWRTEFFGHEPQADLALLAKGFHVAYTDMQDLYGSPKAMKIMDQFHRHLVSAESLAGKTVLEGFSRGGLFAFNWAALHPGQVAALYVDAPVCDIKSWPGGKGKGPGSKADWDKLLAVYGFSEAQAMSFMGNPVDQLAPLAKARIPILAVIGEADEAVPVSENIDRVEKTYRELGGPIEVIRKPGCKHHPHSLKDPAPIVAFVLRAAGKPSP